jgi:hypothetical protein
MSVKLSKGALSNRGKSAVSAVKCKLKWLRNAAVGVGVATLVLSIDTEEAKKVVALRGPTRPKLTVRMTCIGS